MNLPVLLLVYNRTKETKKILNYLIKNNIKKIYVSIDGPKNNKKDLKSNQDLIKIFNLKKYSRCKINILKKNHGCKKGVEIGINWFFSRVNKGIILEDDCIPNQSFFIFCDKMLKKYKNTQVKVISGNNFLNNKIRIKDHCYFSKFNHCWGWATWKDAWLLYDEKLTHWVKFKNTKNWKSLFTNKLDRRYWEKIFDLCRQNYFDSWAYPWMYSILYNRGCCVLPKFNLVKNIGYVGTHNKFNSKFCYPTRELDLNFKYPKKITINIKADEIVMKNFFKPQNLLWPYRFFYLLKIFLINPNQFVSISIKRIKNAII